MNLPEELKVRCSACEGTGEVPMAPQLGEVLGTMTGTPKDWFRTTDIAERLDISPQAAYQRLYRLEELGYVIVRQANLPGRVYEYRRVK